MFFFGRPGGYLFCLLWVAESSFSKHYLCLVGIVEKKFQDIVNILLCSFGMLIGYTVMQSVSEDQAKRFAKFRERKHRVEKDVV